MLEALLAVATRLLALSDVPVRRRALQDELVCAFDRVHRDHGGTARAFCAALALSERTFRSWQDRPATRPPPPPKPPSPPPDDRNSGRFALEMTAPDTQLGGDTTDLCVLGVELKLVGVQDIGDRKRCLYDAFAIDVRESAELITGVVADAVAGREGLQFLTDQGTPYLAEAARQAYDAIGVEHAPQREGTPTEKKPPSSAGSAPSRPHSRRSSTAQSHRRRRPRFLGPVFGQHAQPEDVSRRFLARVAKNLGGDFGYP